MRQRSRRPGRAYAAIPNAAMRDRAITMEARGLLALMMTYSDDWTFVFSHLQEVTGWGRDKLRKHLGELEAAGYLERETVRQAGGLLAGTEWVIVDDPEGASCGASVSDPAQDHGERAENTPPNRPPEIQGIGFTDPLKNRPPEKPTAGISVPIRRTTDKNTNGGGGSACAREVPSFREQLLDAMGVGPDGVAGPSKFIGGTADMAEAARWLALPGLTPEIICTEVRAIMAGKRDGPPSSFRYFTSALQRLSGDLTAPPLEPLQKDFSHDRQPAGDRRAAAADDAFEKRIAFAARNRSPSRPDFGFG